MAHRILQANLNRYHCAKHWLADPDSLRFWTVARHRMAIVPGDQFAL
jgi:hypothetical protein